MKLKHSVAKKWRLETPMLVPAQWQGSVEHFYHFFFGYFMPAALWLEKNPVPRIVVRDSGPMNPWFELLSPRTTVDFIPLALCSSEHLPICRTSKSFGDGMTRHTFNGEILEDCVQLWVHN